MIVWEDLYIRAHHGAYFTGMIASGVDESGGMKFAFIRAAGNNARIHHLKAQNLVSKLKLNTRLLLMKLVCGGSEDWRA